VVCYHTYQFCIKSRVPTSFDTAIDELDMISLIRPVFQLARFSAAAGVICGSTTFRTLNFSSSPPSGVKKSSNAQLRRERDDAIQRANAEMRRANAEATRADAETTRADAVTTKVDAALKRAAAAEVKSYFTQMRAISSSSSVDTVTNADEFRRGAPLPTVVSIEDVLVGIPAAADGGLSSSAQWAAFALDHQTSWKPPKSSAILDEVSDVHPTVRRVLNAITSPVLRIWSGVTAPDDIPKAEMTPDFTATHVRDSALSTLGALLIVEVKLLGDMYNARRQTRIYLRRRVHKLCLEREARGESCEDVFALGVATDGRQVVLMRVDSGAPPAGQSFANAEPCPVVETVAMRLLDWDFASPHSFVGAPQPEGFVALSRLFGAPVAQLGDGSPMESLHASVRWTGVGAFPASSSVPRTMIGSNGSGGSAVAVSSDAVVLQFGSRLGCGGSSDVYELSSTSSNACIPTSVASGVVVKVARIATAAAVASFEAEGLSLGLLKSAASQGLVPELLGVGERSGDRAWPLLILSPRGEQLSEWVRSRSTSAAASATSPDDALVAMATEKRSCARRVALGLFDALEAAHMCARVHCDVRPPNVVIVNNAPVLIDWGSSCAIGANSVGRGVPAYASSRVFQQGSCVAHPAQDVAGVLYTWLCVAFSADCTAPWIDPSVHGDSDICALRSSWINVRRATDAAVAAVADVLATTDGDIRARAADPLTLFSAARAAVSL
jgi:hypothetical protein